MQNLNNRLASYIEKVHSLEQANTDLDRNIREWYDSHTDVTFDHSVFEDTINDLRNEVSSEWSGDLRVYRQSGSPDMLFET